MISARNEKVRHNKDERLLLLLPDIDKIAIECAEPRCVRSRTLYGERQGEAMSKISWTGLLLRLNSMTNIVHLRRGNAVDVFKVDELLLLPVYMSIKIGFFRRIWEA